MLLVTGDLCPSFRHDKEYKMHTYKWTVQLSKTATVKRMEQIMDILPEIEEGHQNVKVSNRDRAIGGRSVNPTGASSVTVAYRIYEEDISLDADDLERIEKELLAVPWVLSVNRVVL